MRKIDIKRVYWKKGQYRYKSRTGEIEALGLTWVALGKTETEAYENYAKLILSRLDTAGGMEKLWQRYESEVLPQKAYSSQKHDRAMWKLLAPIFNDPKSPAHPTDITRQWGIDFLIARGIKGIGAFKPAPSRAKKEYALLRHMMNWAVDWGMINSNPLMGVKVSNYLKIKIRDRAPEVWELIAVKKHASTIIKLFIDFKYMTGLDQQTCFKLPIPSFDGPGIPVRRGKTNKKGFIPWNNEMIQICRELIAYNNNRCPRLFSNKLGHPMRVDTFSQQFRKAVRSALEAGDIAEAFTPNDIRSSHGTDATELYGLDASKQLLNSYAASKHYVHKRRGDKITPLDRPKESSKKT